jgi:hypothetical protein
MKTYIVLFALILVSFICQSQEVPENLTKTGQVEFLSSLNYHHYKFSGDKGDLFKSIQANAADYHDIFSELAATYIAEKNLFKYTGLRALISLADRVYYDEYMNQPELITQMEEVFLNEDAMRVIPQKYPGIENDSLGKKRVYDNYLKSIRIVQDLVVQNLREKGICDPIAVDYCFRRLGKKENVGQVNEYFYYLSECCIKDKEMVSDLRDLLGSLNFYDLPGVRKLFNELFED